MPTLFRLRACRFRALHDLLLGERNASPRHVPHLSQHLAKDVGLPYWQDDNGVFQPPGQMISL